MPSQPAPAHLITAPMAVTLLLLASTPLWLGAVGLYQYLALEIVIWMMFALAHNLLLGYGGLPSFGHGAYFGVGAYAFGLLQQRAGADLIAALLGSIVVAALVGGVVAAFISHRRGIYYALLTIAFGQVMWFIAIKWHAVTGGEDGLLKIERAPLKLPGVEISLAANEAFFYFVLVLFALVLVLLWRLIHSPFGRVLRAIKQNELRAGFVGYNVWLYKWSAFVISAGLSGLAGSLFAMAQQSAYPNVMSLHNSGFVVMMVLIGGGLVSFWGPVIGALIFILARDLLGAYTETWLLWYGLLFMAMVLYQPDGVAGAWQAWRAKRQHRRSAQAPQPQAQSRAA
jgi:branched-chain amino acid transport system permease protein